MCNFAHKNFPDKPQFENSKKHQCNTKMQESKSSNYRPDPFKCCPRKRVLQSKCLLYQMRLLAVKCTNFSLKFSNEFFIICKTLISLWNTKTTHDFCWSIYKQIHAGWERGKNYHWIKNEGFPLRFFIKDFLSKCDQIRGFLWIWSHLLKKPSVQTSFFCAVYSTL